MYFPLCVGVLCLSLLRYSLLCVHFSFCNHLQKEKEAGWFATIVLKMYCYYKCNVALAHGAVGWSSVCDCDIS